MSLLRRFLADEAGATAIEYSLIGTLIAVAIVTGAGATANRLEWLWSNNNSEIVRALSQNN